MITTSLSQNPVSLPQGACLWNGNTVPDPSFQGRESLLTSPPPSPTEGSECALLLGKGEGRVPPTHRSWPSSVGDGNARSSRPMLMRTWLVSGQTWGVRSG